MTWSFPKVAGLTIASVLILSGCQAQPDVNTTAVQPVQDNPAENTVEQTPSAVVINTKTITWNKAAYTFTQSCEGQVQKNATSGTSSVTFCLGKNTLALTDAKKVMTVLSTITEQDVVKAPVFTDAQLIPGSVNGTVLLSYGEDSCDTTAGTSKDTCGAGMPSNYVTMAVNLKDATKHDLKNYPGNGVAVWNASGTKAIFIPDTCGGAGCDTGSLIGYTPTTDKINESLTAEKAAGFGKEQKTVTKLPFTTMGEKLPIWKKVSWTSDSAFTAVIVGINMDMRDKTITGKF